MVLVIVTGPTLMQHTSRKTLTYNNNIIIFICLNKIHDLIYCFKYFGLANQHMKP